MDTKLAETTTSQLLAKKALPAMAVERTLQANTKLELQPEPKSGSKFVSQPKSEPESDLKCGPTHDSEPEPKPPTKPKSVPEAGPDIGRPESEPEETIEPTTEPEADPRPAPKSAYGALESGVQPLKMPTEKNA